MSTAPASEQAVRRGMLALARLPFDQRTASRLAREAGIGIATLYRVFKAKPALLPNGWS